MNPGKESADLAKDVSAVNSALGNLDTQRRSVDGLETPAPTAISQYDSASTDLAQLNTAIAASANDPELARGLTTFANLNAVKAAEANEAALSVALVQAGQFPQTWPSNGQAAVPCQVVNSSCDIYNALTVASGDEGNAENVYYDSATADQKGLLRNATGSTAGAAMAAVEKQIFDTVTFAYPTAAPATSPLNASNSVRHPGRPLGRQPGPVVAQGGHRPGRQLRGRRQGRHGQGGQRPADPAQVGREHRHRRGDQHGPVAAVQGPAGSHPVRGRRLRLDRHRPAHRLLRGPGRDRAAEEAHDRRLHAVHRQAARPGRAPAEPRRERCHRSPRPWRPIDINSKDEIGQLADAFNSIQHVTIEVAEEQGALLRKGIGDIFINLARRNQTLLDRQIEFIDQLEANEEDADQLDNLFKLDHLATRMRRNAESLLVLAGAEPPRRRGRPVALADVVRVAIGEVEDFARISLLALDDVTVGGNVAVDLAHLLSELMENATHFSPPDTTVEIVGHRAEDGYTLSVSDQGIGMSADQLAEANTQLARPPLVGLALSRSLGFIVIGRLASRFGVAVRLTSSPSGGVTALVTLPPELVTVDGQPMVAPRGRRAEVDAAARPARLRRVAVTEVAEPDIVVVDEETDAAVAADAAAGVELELDEFADTLDRAEFEDEVHAAEAAAGGRGRGRDHRSTT